MPVHRGQDKDGPFYQYGNGDKYHYQSNNKVSREHAYALAIVQMHTIIYNILTKRNEKKNNVRVTPNNT